MIKKIWLNFQLYLLFFLFTCVYTPLLAIIVIGARPFIGKRRMMKLFRFVIAFYGKIVIRVLPWPWVKVRFNDREPQLTPPYIVICNHRAASDPFLMAVLKHETVQVVNKWPLRLPLLGLMGRLSGCLSVNEMPYADFNAKVKMLLEEGVCVAAFPEGTRSGSRQMGQFHGAMFRIAVEAGVPVVPMVITGNEDKPKKGTLWLEPGVICVEKLPALTAQDYHNKNAFCFKNQVRDIIASQIQKVER